MGHEYLKKNFPIYLKNFINEKKKKLEMQEKDEYEYDFL